MNLKLYLPYLKTPLVSTAFKIVTCKYLYGMVLVLTTNQKPASTLHPPFSCYTRCLSLLVLFQRPRFNSNDQWKLWNDTSHH